MASAISDKWTFFDRLIQTIRYRKVIDLIPYGCVLADLGCGEGDFLRYINIKRQIAFGYGIDKKIKYPNANIYQNLLFKEGDLNKRIPLDNTSVDVVTALAVIEHLYNPSIFVLEILRILKPGGVCILTTPSPIAKPLLEFMAYRLRIISEKDIRDHKHYFNEYDLSTLFKDFDPVKINRFLFGFNVLIEARKKI